MIKLIGLSGYAQSGKDTAAEFLQGYGFRRVAFADSIRNALYALNPRIGFRDNIDAYVTVKDVVDSDGWDVAKIGYPEIRELLQRLGTEVGRKQFGEDFWVNLALKPLSPNFSYVFTDCRFPEEAQMIKDRGGKVWRIERPGTEAVNRHASETSLDDWDFDVTIFNNTDLEGFKEAVYSGLEA